MCNKTNLIATKLIIPRPRKNYIRRESILSELDNILDYKVTIIRGAAGSGKSTLLSSFIQEKILKNVGWISLDRENNEWKSFWHYLIEIFKKYLDDNGEQLTNTFSAFMRKDEIFKVIPYLINELSKKDDIFIVFDDYHYIKDPFLNSTVEYLIKYSSHNIHYIFLTREEIPLYLGELRVQGQILEIYEDNLKFSKKECLSFVKNTLNMDISEESVDKIFNITEGWIAGIQLIVLALKNKREGLFKGIKGLNKYVIEYLTEEILKQLNEKERDFLVKTSILNYFNKDLCDYILNITNAEEIINSLIDKNLFIIIIDEERGVYRYHHLFKEFLNLSFLKISKETQENVRIRAYEFYKKLGDYEESIKHLLEIKYYDKALKEIENNAQNIEGWSYLKEIPIEYLIKSKELTVQLLFYYFVNLEMDECKRLINIVEEKIRGEEWLEIVEVFKIYLYDSIPYVKLNLECIEKFNFSDVTKGILYINICYIFFTKGEIYKTISYLDKSNSIGEKYNIPYISLFSKSIKACALEELGDLSESEIILKQIKVMIEKMPILNNLMFTYYLGIAGIHMKRGKLEEAEKEINLAKNLFYKDYGFLEKGILYNFIELEFLKGDTSKGKQLANKLIIEYTSQEGQLLIYLYSLRIKYYISSGIFSKGDLEEYKQLFETQQKKFNTYIRIDEKINYAITIYKLGEIEKAKDILNECLEYSRKNSLKIYLVDGLIAMVLILEQLNESKRKIFNLLREAIYYSYDNRYLKAYLIEGRKILNVIKKLKNDEDIELTLKEKNFIKDLTNIMEPKRIKLEMLTPREKEVLEVLAKGHSNKEIAKELNISLATVKTHIINIYSKLGVSNRVQAVEECKKLNQI